MVRTRAPRLLETPEVQGNLVTDKGQSFVFGAKRAGPQSTVCLGIGSEDTQLLNTGDTCWTLKHYQDGMILASHSRNMGHQILL